MQNGRHVTPGYFRLVGMKLLIQGATGHMGRELVDLALARGHVVCRGPQGGGGGNREISVG